MLEQWEALKLFFSDMWLAEKLVAAESSFNSLHDPFVKTVFPILTGFSLNSLNLIDFSRQIK